MSRRDVKLLLLVWTGSVLRSECRFEALLVVCVSYA